MNKRFCFSFPRPVFFVIGATLFVLGLSACATSPVTPTVLSGVTTGNHKVELIFKTAVIAGSNDIRVKVNEAASGEPLRHTDVRLKVEKRAPIATATNTHDTPGTKDHESAKVDPHASPKVESHDDVKKKDDHEDDAGHDLTASSIAGEYVGQLNLPEAGEWLVTVHFMADGAEKEAAFAVTANRDWGKFAVLSGFLGVNVAVIAAAAITKGKFVKGTQIKETRS
ncbi:MAG: hypothetical protein HZB52_01975 [Chloroflexi bacterium]|nr:hypothetical protein [Chloroflexota bacterium]